MTQKDPLDPKGLIRESYRIDGITDGECRSIFLDWALGVPQTVDTAEQVTALLAHYENAAPADHPMTQTLRAALTKTGPARRRGGRSARLA